MAALQASGANRVPAPASKTAAHAAQPTGAPSFAEAGIHHVATLIFANGSAEIAAKDRATLRRIAAASRSAGAVIRVVGYASPAAGNLSPAERKLANFNISFRRAEAVREALIRAGAAPGNIKIVAASDNSERFGVPSTNTDTRPRVEIFLEN
jgi:outer membrane protein OmpA-like peptidoglycan-associated protein